MANPNKSAYAFGIDRAHPGWFVLSFKSSKSAKPQNWGVKVTPGAFSLNGTELPNIGTLCNAFKMQYTKMMAEQGYGAGGRTPGYAAGGRTPNPGAATPFGASVRPDRPVNPYLQAKTPVYTAPAPAPAPVAAAVVNNDEFIHPSRRAMQQGYAGR